MSVEPLSSAEANSLFRRKPVGDRHGPQLNRTIGTFQLTMFGVGATVGTGIFFVLASAVPEAGPAVILSFLLAGTAAGLAAICYAEMASSVPVSGSTYSYAYATLGEIIAMGVAACLLLEYGVSTAAVAVGWSGYVNEALVNITGLELPQAILAAPWGVPGQATGLINLPAVVLVVPLHAAADPRRERVGQGERDHGGDQALGAGDVLDHRLHRVRLQQLRRLRPVRSSPASPLRPARSSSPSSAWMRCRPRAMRSRTRRRRCRGP